MAKQTNRRKRSVFNETHLQSFFSKIEELRNYVKKIEKASEMQQPSCKSKSIDLVL